MKREEALDAAVKLTAAPLHSDTYGHRGHLDEDSDLAMDIFSRAFSKLQEANV